MEYALIFILQLLGIGLSILQKITGLGDKFPNFDRKQIISTFFNEDWDTLIGSALVLILDLTVHFICNYYQAPFTSHPYYIFISFGLALLLGYAGQRIIYRVLGTSEKALNKKIDSIDK